MQLLTRAKTEFEHEQYPADLQEVSVALGQPLPDGSKVGVIRRITEE